MEDNQDIIESFAQIIESLSLTYMYIPILHSEV